MTTQKVTDIYALDVDYEPRAPLTREFFATVSAYLDLAENRAQR